MDFTKDFMKEQTGQKGLSMSIFLFLQFEKKENKNFCLEESVNNSRLMQKM